MLGYIIWGCESLTSWILFCFLSFFFFKFIVVSFFWITMNVTRGTLIVLYRRGFHVYHWPLKPNISKLPGEYCPLKLFMYCKHKSVLKYQQQQKEGGRWRRKKFGNIVGVSERTLHYTHSDSTLHGYTMLPYHSWNLFIVFHVSYMHVFSHQFVPSSCTITNYVSTLNSFTQFCTSLNIIHTQNYYSRPNLYFWLYSLILSFLYM